jgi:hypothetical protein
MFQAKFCETVGQLSNVLERPSFGASEKNICVYDFHYYSDMCVKALGKTYLPYRTPHSWRIILKISSVFEMGS